MNKYSIKGNICAGRVRLARILQKPAITQDALARQLNALGFAYISRSVISKIERNQRHVTDMELRAIAQVLNVPIDWLAGKGEPQDIFQSSPR